MEYVVLLGKLVQHLVLSLVHTVQLLRHAKTRQENVILIRLHRVQYGENINKIDSQSVFCSGSWHSIQ